MAYASAQFIADVIACEVNKGDAGGAVAAVARFENAGILVDWRDGDNTVLHYLLYFMSDVGEDPAKARALLAAVQALLSCGASPVAENELGATPLSFVKNNAAIFKELVEAARKQLGAEIDFKSVLKHAVMRDDCVMVELLLLEYGVCPWASSCNGGCMIHHAGLATARLLVEAVRNRPSPEELLLGKVWSKDERAMKYVNSVDVHGRTPLHTCPNSDLAEFLIGHGVDVNAKDMRRDAFYKIALEEDRHYPAGDVGDPRDLLKKVEDNMRGQMPKEVGKEVEKYMRKVMQWGTMQESPDGGPGEPGSRVALAYALAQGWHDGSRATKLVKVLIDAGASIGEVDDEDLTPLQYGDKYGATIHRQLCHALRWRCILLPEALEKARLEDHANALQLARDRSA